MDLSQEDWWEKAQQDKDAVILDVRTANEWNSGIIPGAINIDIYKGPGFIEEVEKLDKDKIYYVYCAAGARSGQACNVLIDLGFAGAYNLAGGMSRWQGPVVAPE